MNHEDAHLSEIGSQISSAVARIVLRLLPRIPRTEWRNRIIPFPAIYKKVGYAMKLNRNATRRVLGLLSMRNEIGMIKLHRVVLQERVAEDKLWPQVRFPYASACASANCSTTWRSHLPLCDVICREPRSRLPPSP